MVAEDIQSHGSISKGSQRANPTRNLRFAGFGLGSGPDQFGISQARKSSSGHMKDTSYLGLANSGFLPMAHLAAKMAGRGLFVKHVPMFWEAKISYPETKRKTYIFARRGRVHCFDTYPNKGLLEKDPEWVGGLPRGPSRISFLSTLRWGVRGEEAAGN